MTLDLTPEERRALAGKARAGGAAEGHYQRGPPPLAADTGAAPHSGEAGTAGSREGEHSVLCYNFQPVNHLLGDRVHRETLCFADNKNRPPAQPKQSVTLVPSGKIDLYLLFGAEHQL